MPRGDATRRYETHRSVFASVAGANDALAPIVDARARPRRKSPLGYFLVVFVLSAVVFVAGGAPYAGLCFSALTVLGTIIFPTS